MTIEQRGIVDFIGISRETGTKILTISDHLEWTDYEYHSTLLQSKIDDYLEHIYSNELHETRSESGGVSIRIQLIMKYEPTRQGTMLLGRIGAEIERLGFDFVHSVFGG
jgi:hypothetical protein